MSRADRLIAEHEDYTPRRKRGRPRHDTYADIDAVLILLANDRFRSGVAPSAWSAIALVVKKVWAFLENHQSIERVMVGHLELRAPDGKSLTPQKVLGARKGSVTQRVFERLRHSEPYIFRRAGRTIRFRLTFSPAPGRLSLTTPGKSIFSHLPIYKARQTPRASPAQAVAA